MLNILRSSSTTRILNLLFGTVIFLHFQCKAEYRTAAGAVFSRHMDNLSQNFQDAIEKHETQPETREEPAAEETEYL